MKTRLYSQNTEVDLPTVVNTISDFSKCFLTIVESRLSV